MKFRNLRVGSLITEELALIIVRETEFSGALVTVSSVDVDKKMERALVNVSVIPSEKFKEVFGVLQKKQGYFQHLLLKKINIKPMPMIMFREDHGLEKAAAIERALMEAKKEKTKLRRRKK